ncbi:hypothetical protein [Phaeovulum sp. W22_SRMD_FR3]|jgi:ABC-type transporter Mla subunit MlaD|uniref:hypothetical protein n=1 Tax=Phaeovulum sp. W22_SRMD_FR3 TaxID=3240274 RepID=UPI003F9DB412
MAEANSNNTAMGFILGAVVVVLGGLIWYMATDGNMFGHENKAEITIDLPNAGN